MAKEYTFKKKISAEDIENIISSAWTGIAYWCDDTELKENVEVDMPLDEAITNGFSIKIHDSKENKWHTLTLKKFLKGLEMMNNFDYYDYDKESSDKIIQYALFGELRYS